MIPEVLVIIQCRYNSRRLPGKALLTLAGTTMLSFLIRRLQWGLGDAYWKIVLATTERRDDDPVARTAHEEGLNVIRGATDDVLSRFGLCLDNRPDTKALVRVTADNPLTCPLTIKQIVDKLSQSRADYVFCEGYPLGTTADVFSSETILRLLREAEQPPQREHINKFILDNNDCFSISTINAKGTIARPDLSFTVDTREEWQRMTSLFSESENKPWEINLNEAVARMDRFSVS